MKIVRKVLSASTLSRELGLYLLSGVLTTLVNLGIFSILTRVVGLDKWYYANFPAVVGAIIFAFVINKTVVFRSKAGWFEEFCRFIPMRVLVSLIFEYGALALFYNVFQVTSAITIATYQIGIAKLLTQVFVVVGNYVLSKFYVFRNNNIKENLQEE